MHTVHYEIEGHYPVDRLRLVTGPRQWLLWQKAATLPEAQAIKARGDELISPTKDDMTFNALRIIEVRSSRHVL